MSEVLVVVDHADGAVAQADARAADTGPARSASRSPSFFGRRRRGAPSWPRPSSTARLKVYVDRRAIEELPGRAQGRGAGPAGRRRRGSAPS